MARSRPGGSTDVLVEALPSVSRLLPAFLPAQRWFGGKGRRISRVRLIDQVRLRGAANTLLAIGEVRYADGAGGTERYVLPLALTYGDRAGAPPPILRVGPATVRDAFGEDDFCRALLAAIARNAVVQTEGGGVLTFRSGPALGARPSDRTAVQVRRIGAEQSNTSVIYDDALILKAFRRLHDGVNPEVETLRVLAERADLAAVPALAGWAEYRGPGGAVAALAILQRYVPNEGDGWTYTLRELAALLEDESRVTSHDYLASMAELGRITANLHLALASATSEAFAPQPIGAEDVRIWRLAISSRLDAALGRLRERLGDQPEATRRLGAAVLEAEAHLRATVNGLDALAAGVVAGRRGQLVKTRHHGDYHLGQVLKTADSFVILDFEGEPLRPLAERRARHTPLKDVAGMLRSFNYARHTALRSALSRVGSSDPSSTDPDSETAREAVVASRLDSWERLTRRAFLDAYVRRARAAQARFLPTSDAALHRALAALELEKALYELQYELDNRPDWLPIPLAALAAV